MNSVSVLRKTLFFGSKILIRRFYDEDRTKTHMHAQGINPGPSRRETSQSELLITSRKRRQARENSKIQIMTIIGIFSNLDWLKTSAAREL